MAIVTFYLGTHMPGWLATAGVPLFVSHRRLVGRRSLPRAIAPWALDSGGFTELAMHGEWRTKPVDYCIAVERYRDEVGSLAWAAPQDWMCEPHMLAKTGKSVADHQRLTVENFVALRGTGRGLPFIPVLQGWATDDYLACIDLYARHEIDLTREPVVGIGSVCRRHKTAAVVHLIRVLHETGIRCHAFGLKTDGWRRARGYLASADSMAWSFDARRKPPLYGHTHKSCANCLAFALQWRDRHIGQAWEPQL